MESDNGKGTCPYCNGTKRLIEQTCGDGITVRPCHCARLTQFEQARAALAREYGKGMTYATRVLPPMRAPRS